MGRALAGVPLTVAGSSTVGEGGTENGVALGPSQSDPLSVLATNQGLSLGLLLATGGLESWVFIWIYSNWQNSVLLEATVET